jgi:hypothetical protein
MEQKALLIGDNPFHNISHLSQERSRTRKSVSVWPEKAADLVCLSFENGANGFMFSVSDTTLAILKAIRKRSEIERLSLYAIVPYAYEYVRIANQKGGLSGLAKRFGRQLVASRKLGAVASGVKGVLQMDPSSLLRTYLSYEISRIQANAGKKAKIEAVFLHELITDMALALNLDWLFDAYSEWLLKRDITPGFNTCNFPFLIEKLREWHHDLEQFVIAAPFNKVGFQMNPSRMECEKALANINAPITIAISVLAAGYLKLPQAVDYITGLPNLKGVAVGISTEKHARQTFALFRDRFS